MASGTKNPSSIITTVKAVKRNRAMMLGHGHFLFGGRDEAAGETDLGFESPSGRMSPFSLERSGVDSSDVPLKARADLVE
jgi:hypothetical protein